MKRIFDKDFIYVNSASTDVRRTIEREQKRLQAEREREKQEAAAHLRNVIQRKFTKEKS